MNATDPRRAALVGLAAYFVTSVFWGANMPLTAIILRVLDPFWMTPWRLTIATATLLLLVLATEGAGALRMPIPWRRTLLMGLAIASFFVTYNVGLRYTNVITAAAFMAGSPVYAAVTLRLLTGAKLEPGFWIAAPLTLLGAGIAVYGRSLSSGQAVDIQGGEPLIVLCIVQWTVYSILAQRWFGPAHGQLRRTYVASVGGLPWVFAAWATAWAIGWVGPPNLAPDGETVMWLVLTSVLATAIAGVTWNIGASRLGIAVGSLWQNAVPVFGVLISMLFAIYPTREQVVGGAIVVAGVLYMQWRKMRA